MYVKEIVPKPGGILLNITTVGDKIAECAASILGYLSTHLSALMKFHGFQLNCCFGRNGSDCHLR
jgi:hypothetical protein